MVGTPHTVPMVGEKSPLLSKPLNERTVFSSTTTLESYNLRTTMLRRNRNFSRGRNDPVESRTNEKDEDAHVRQIVLYAGCDRSDRVVFQWAVLQRSLSQICRCLCLPSPSRNPDDSQICGRWTSLRNGVAACLHTGPN